MTKVPEILCLQFIFDASLHCHPLSYHKNTNRHQPKSWKWKCPDGDWVEVDGDGSGRCENREQQQQQVNNAVLHACLVQYHRRHCEATQMNSIAPTTTTTNILIKWSRLDEIVGEHIIMNRSNKIHFFRLTITNFIFIFFSSKCDGTMNEERHKPNK